MSEFKTHTCKQMHVCTCTHTFWIPHSLSKTYFCEDPLFSWVFQNKHCSHAAGTTTSVAAPPGSPASQGEGSTCRAQHCPWLKAGAKIFVGWTNKWLSADRHAIKLHKEKFSKKKVRDALFTWSQNMIQVNKLDNCFTKWLQHNWLSGL